MMTFFMLSSFCVKLTHYGSIFAIPYSLCIVANQQILKSFINTLPFAIVVLHWLYHGFDEGDFIFGEVVFGVELSVNLRHALAPVDVTSLSEILHRNKLE